MINPASTTILAADDDFAVLHALTTYLQEEGYTVIPVQDGVEALQQFREKPVDLVLSDVVMPNMSGYQLCQELRRESTVPIIVLTSLQNIDSVRSAFQAGVDDYLPKSEFRQIGLQRIATILHWAQGRSHEEERRVLTVGRLHLDERQVHVQLDDKQIPLSAVEYRLLRCLCEQPVRSWLRSELAPWICGSHLADYALDVLDLLVARVRHKVEPDPSSPSLLLSGDDAYYLNPL